MQRVPLPIVGAAYEDSDKTISTQDLVNWFLEVVEEPGGRVKVALKGCSGLILRVTVGDGPIRGMKRFLGKPYAVSGNKLYVINTDWTGTLIGTVMGGTDRVAMEENGTQLVISDSSGGYIYDGTTLSAITDADFPGSRTLAFITQYIVGSRTGTGQFFHSDLATAADYSSLDVATAEAHTDELLAVFVDHLELWLAGTDGTELWTPTGGGSNAFQRNDGKYMERGAASPYTHAKIDNSVAWLGDDGIVYRASGYVPQRISTHAVEQDIATWPDKDAAFAFSFTDRGHKFYYLTSPQGRTWGWDAATGKWHRRQSYGLTKWLANAHVFAYDTNLFGSYGSGAIYELGDDTTYDEGGEPLIAERISQYAHSEQKRVFMSELELLFDTGNGLASGQGSDPMVDMRHSDDFGRNYTNYRRLSLGTTGQYGKPVRTYGLGSFKQRCFHIRVSDPVKRDLLAATAVIEVGD